jgi:hypothetical protein
MEVPELWVANGNGTEIIHAMDTVAVVPDNDGNVAARLAGHDGLLVTLVAHRTHRDVRRAIFTVAASRGGPLGDSSGAQIVLPAHENA